MNRKIYSFIGLFVCLIILGFTTHTHENIPSTGYVPDAKTAINVAEKMYELRSPS